MRELEATLRRIDGRGYKAYKELQGAAFRFDRFRLHIDHVQGDPYAAPSRARAVVPLDTAHLPPSVTASPPRCRATRDFVARAFQRAVRARGELGIDAGRQTVLDRTACLIGVNDLEIRFTVDLPGDGRRVLGRRAAEVLIRDLPVAVDRSAVAHNLDLLALERHCAVVEDQEALRMALGPAGLIAFVGNGSVLPRRSGVDDRPLERPVAFQSPPSLEVVLEAPNAGSVCGMGIPKGITLIVGGGFHGKSTLLRALESGPWDHVPDDGRELVVADPEAVKIRAEDGRAVHAVDISPYISNLPANRDTTAFSTDLASGSTSQAAALVEAVEAGASALLLDEDTSATNFMIRDRRMQALVVKSSEPITPFIDRVRQLRDGLGVSTVLVMGGSGDYFDHADLVIQMDSYLPRDVSNAARDVAAAHPTGRFEEDLTPLLRPEARRLETRSLHPERARNRWKIQARGMDTLVFGRSEIDVRAVDQLEDPSQLRTIGWLLGRLSECRVHPVEPLPLVREMIDRLADGEWDWLTGRSDGDLALPRPQEVMAALNRLRGALFSAGPRHGD